MSFSISNVGEPYFPSAPAGAVIPTPDVASQQPSTRFDKQIDRIDSPPAAPGKAGFQFPFQINKIDPATVNVRYGTLMDIPPANIATDIPLTVDGTNTFYLDVEVDIDGVVIAVTLSNGTSGQPADTDYHGYITLGSVILTSGIITGINQAATHSLRMAMCGRVVSSGALVVPGTYEFWGF